MVPARDLPFLSNPPYKHELDTQTNTLFDFYSIGRFYLTVMLSIINKEIPLIYSHLHGRWDY